MSFQSAVKASAVGTSVQYPFPAIGDDAPDFELIGTDGQPISLSSYWAVKPTVFVFLRHFGCPFCREQVALLRQEYLKFQSIGAQIVCIGQGPYKAGKAFSIIMGIEFPVLVCGDDLTVYEKYSLSKGTLKQLIGVNVIKRGFSAIRHGIGLGVVEGDPGQLPGVFIVNKLGKVILAHRGVDQADNIAPKALLAALRQQDEA